jgi:hypothetical protein
MTTVGERIRRARTAHKPRWSQQKLADALSAARWGTPGFCHRHEVYRWEAGRRLPTVWLPYLEQVLGIDLTDEQAPESGDTVLGRVGLVDADVDCDIDIATDGLAALTYRIQLLSANYGSKPLSGGCRSIRTREATARSESSASTTPPT